MDRIDQVGGTAESRRLHIYWLPGHKGIVENETVDEIAKRVVRLVTQPLQDIRKFFK